MDSEKQQDLICLQHWYRTPLGRLFGEMEHRIIEEFLAKLFGYYIIAFQLLPERDFLATSPMQNRYYLRWLRGSSMAGADLQAQPDYMPIANDCIDAAVLPHILEFSEEPIAILKELDRVLIPEGHVIITGFNPNSLLGMRDLLRIDKGLLPRKMHWIAVRTLSDWLGTMGFTIVCVRCGFFRLPSSKQIMLDKSAFLEAVGAQWWPGWGSGYVILAKKRVSTLTLLKPRWRSRRRLLAEGVINRVTKDIKRNQTG